MPHANGSTTLELNSQLLLAANEILAYLARAQPILATLVMELRTSGIQPVRPTLDELAQGLDWVARYSGSIQQAEGLIGAVITDPFGQFNQQLTTTVGTINEALMNNDAILLADSIEFELFDLLSRLNDSCQELRSRCNPQ